MIANPERQLAEHLAWLDQQQIHVSGRIAQEVFPKVNPSVFADALRRQIDLSAYGNGIEKFFFTFVALENTSLKFDGLHYDAEQHRVEVAIAIPIDEVISATQKATFALMGKAYLEGIQLLGTLDLGDSFDYKAFQEDVAIIFAEDDWYAADLATYQAA